MSIASTQNSTQGPSTELKTMRTTTPSQSMTKALHKSTSRDTRFTVCVLMVCAVSFGVLMCQTAVSVHLPGFALLLQLAILVLGGYMYEWTWVHSRGLTRVRRAYFDETNVLETYKPRDRTHGHLFIPDPPTPGPTQPAEKRVTFGEGTEEHNIGHSSFNVQRDVHYANEYQRALQMAKELENHTMSSAAAQDAAPSAKPQAVSMSASTRSGAEKDQKRNNGQEEKQYLGKTQMPELEEKDELRATPFVFNDSLEIPRDNSSNKETTIIKTLNDSIENLKSSIILTNHTDVPFQKTIPDDDEELFVYMVESGDYSNASKIKSIVVRVDVTNKIDQTVLNTSIQHMIEHLADRPRNCHIWLKTLQANKLIEFIRDMLIKPDVQAISRSLFRLETRDVYTNMGTFLKDLMAIREHGIRVTGGMRVWFIPRRKKPSQIDESAGPYCIVLISYLDKTVIKTKSTQARHQYITVDQLVQAEHVVEFADEGQMFEFEVDAEPEDLNPVTMAYDPILSFSEFYSVLSKKFPNSCDA
ncbi:unnamed protein product, partial [Mesorhabditis belari]|uniref:Uncharacterized protein n=1 Tax=Mesorhabditis belari TaxID=2138241 RepID=A0AAF3EVU3_9BILA